MKSRTKHSHLEIHRTYAKGFLEASDFFKSAGVEFIEPTDEVPRHHLEILIDDDLKCIEARTIFSFKMSSNALVNVHSRLTEGFKKESEGKNFIKAINDAVSELYAKGETAAFALASASLMEENRIEAKKITKIVKNILEPPIDYSMGNDSIDSWPKLYKALGGYLGVKIYVKEVLKAAAKSLPLDKEGRITMRNELPKIKCYTCEYCKVGPTGIRTCGKVETAITGAQFDKHPNRYTDAHRNENSGKLVSAVIDKRMDTCENYVCRIK